MKFLKDQKKKTWNSAKGKWETKTIYFYTIVISKYELFRGYPSTKYIVDTNTECSIQSPINDLVRAVNGLHKILRDSNVGEKFSKLFLEHRAKGRGKKRTDLANGKVHNKRGVPVNAELPN